MALDGRYRALCVGLSCRSFLGDDVILVLNVPSELALVVLVPFAAAHDSFGFPAVELGYVQKAEEHVVSFLGQCRLVSTDLVALAKEGLMELGAHVGVCGDGLVVEASVALVWAG